MLAKAPSLIAFGELPQCVSLGSREEFEKGLVAALRRGGHSLLIDNVNNPDAQETTPPAPHLSERPAFLRTLGRAAACAARPTASLRERMKLKGLKKSPP